MFYNRSTSCLRAHHVLAPTGDHEQLRHLRNAHCRIDQQQLRTSIESLDDSVLHAQRVTTGLIGN
jgi:hypothetical protein